MLKQFPLQLGEQPVDLMFLSSTLLMGAPATATNSTVSASFRISLLFAWRRLCQGRGTCTQSETLLHINLPTVTKKWHVAIPIIIMAQNAL